MKRKSNIWIGLLIGVVVPAVIVGIVNLFLILNNKYLTSDIFQNTLLLGIGANALFMRIFFNKKQDYLSIGIVIVSLLLFIYWFLVFISIENV